MKTPLTTAYERIATRSLDAAQAALDGSVQEKSAFLSYHAFESIGGALCESRSRRYPRKHPNKLNAFVTTARPRTYGLSVAVLAVALASVRNELLYPDVSSLPAVGLPEHFMSRSAAERLLRRVRGAVGQVQRDL